jgi:hypothetical protein
MASSRRNRPLGDGNRIASRLSREQLCCEALGEHRRQYGGGRRYRWRAAVKRVALLVTAKRQ